MSGNIEAHDYREVGEYQNIGFADSTTKVAMTTTDYLELTARTCKVFQDGMDIDEYRSDLLHAILGISGEAGELLDGFKKSLIYGKLIDEENLKEEAGDILWYMALLLRTLNISFEEIMAQNIAKLQKRYPDRYTDMDALARADKQPSQGSV